MTIRIDSQTLCTPISCPPGCSKYPSSVALCPNTRESKSSMRYWHPEGLYDVAFFRPGCRQPSIRVDRDQEVGEKVREMEEDNIGMKWGAEVKCSRFECPRYIVRDTLSRLARKWN